jgi:ABC-2 type transport system permease protein
MNIISILIKEIKQNLREKKGMTMMVLFPILLIAVLGTALTGAFTDARTFDDIKVLYTVEGSNTVSSSFKIFIDKSKDIGIVYDEAKSVQEGMDSVKDVKYVSYIRVQEDEGKILLYKNNRYNNVEASLVEAVLESYVQRYNAMSEIVKINPAATDSITTESDTSYVSEISLTKKRAPRAIDYYAVTMLTLIIMYASMTGAWAIKEEKVRKTGSRILCSPVRKYEMFIGKTFGSCLVTIIQAAVVVLFSKFVFKAYWGADMVTISALIISEIIMSISLGIAVAFMVKNENTMTGILNTLIPFTVFLGGGYIPLEQFGDTLLLKAANLSPLKWTHNAIFQVIYDGGSSFVTPALVINIGIAFVLMILSAYHFKKEAI